MVCIKQVPATTAAKRYTADLRLDRAAAEAVINPLDEYAIEQALRLQESGAVESVGYLSMGPDQAGEALRRALAMGGDDATLVTDPALGGADAWATARVLAAALDKLAPDVALMGMASDDARGSLVPGAVAAFRAATRSSIALCPRASFSSSMRPITSACAKKSETCCLWSRTSHGT